MSTIVTELRVVEELIEDVTNEWVIVPRPIKSLAGPKKRAEFEKAVKDGRWELRHKDWKGALEAARELSQRGGIETVQIVHVQHMVRKHAVFKDGEQIAKS